MDEFQARIEAIGDQLRAKISSKFQTSTFLAGFAFTILGIQISGLWQSRIPQLIYVSIALLIVAITLYICAIVKLDELTMPKRFWEESKDGVNSGSPGFAFLTDEDLWELRNRMIFYWMWLTLVATILTATSLLLMLLPFPTKDINTENSINLLWQTFTYTIIAIAFTLAYLIILYFIARKRFKSLLRPVD